MSFIIGGVLASIMSGAMYLYRDSLINYFYPNPRIKPIYDITRQFRSVGGHVLEFGIINNDLIFIA